MGKKYFKKLNETDTSLYFLTVEKTVVSLPTKCLGNPTRGSASGGDYTIFSAIPVTNKGTSTKNSRLPNSNKREILDFATTTDSKVAIFNFGSIFQKGAILKSYAFPPSFLVAMQ